MTITAASIEADGWVLRLDLVGSMGGFADYALDPNGSPRITLASTHAGFVRSGGQAIAGSIVRSIIGTKALRKPAQWTGSNLAAFVVDETDLGGGAIRVRIALSEHVYATDTALSLTVAAGWRTGQAAAAGIAVTNNSTVAAPVPIMRWAVVPYGVTTGSFAVAIYVASHHPVGLDPVAGVKFTATDGTTVKTVWTTALGTDSRYGDNLRCYTAMIDPATAVALTAGILRCDAEIYPWLGTMRSTDPAGTRSMAALSVDGRRTSAESPYMIGYDPAGTRYNSQFAFIDPVNGTTVASAAMIAPTLAAARAIAPAQRPRNVFTATQAGYLTNRTLPAANGNPAQTRSVDGLQCVLAAGTHVLGTTSITSGIGALEIPLRIYGDPANSDPRANCILQTAPTGIWRINRVDFSNLTIEMGTDILAAGGIIWTFDNVTFQGKPGQTSRSEGLLAGVPNETVWSVAMTRCRWWRYAANVMSGNPRIGIFRANAFSRGIGSFLFAANNRLIGNVEDGTTGTGAFTVLNGFSSPTVAGQVEDIIIVGNDLRYLRGRAWTLSMLPAGLAGTPNQSLRRNAMIGNVVERIGPNPEPFYSFGEDTSATMTYNIIEANSFVGDRANSFYSDPLPATLAAVDTQRNQALVNRVANNAFDWLPTKHDSFNDPTSAMRRGSANGFRPQMIEAWSMLYGVGHEANVDTNRDDNEFRLEFSGLRSATGYNGALDPLYADDRSLIGSGDGGGDYRPLTGSVLVGRGVRGNGDADAAGRPRVVPFTVGAFQVAPVDLVPQSARSPQTAMPAILTPELAPTLAPASARLPGLASSPLLAWTTMLTPDSGQLGQSALAAGIALRLELRPADAAMGLVSGAPTIVPGPVHAIAPASTRHRMFSSAAVPTLLPGAAIATLIIGADPRTIYPVRN